MSAIEPEPTAAPGASAPHAERFADAGGGIRLCYEEIGDPAGVPLLLVAGLGQQLIAWPDGFCAALAARGLRVIRFDNRDVGRSTRAPNPPPTRVQFATRRWAPEQYTLTDMTRDTAGLLDALGLESAHVAGMSMGGMIAQTLAAQQPARVRTLTSIFSTTGARRVGRPALSTWRLMLSGPPADRAQALDRAVVLWRHIGSHGFPFDEPGIREAAGLAWDRGHDPAGVERQLAAIFKSRDRTRELHGIAAPTLVIRGDRDMLIHPSGGRATAQAIPGARLETIVGMGHDLPAGAWPRLVDLIAQHIDSNERTGWQDASQSPLRVAPSS
jgi:pimeloyl-ACP methyl ester carboxylesterase